MVFLGDWFDDGWLVADILDEMLSATKYWVSFLLLWVLLVEQKVNERTMREGCARPTERGGGDRLTTRTIDRPTD